MITIDFLAKTRPRCEWHAIVKVINIFIYINIPDLAQYLAVIFILIYRWRRHAANRNFAWRLPEEWQLQCLSGRLGCIMRPAVLSSRSGKYTTGSEMSRRHSNDFEKFGPADRQNHLRRAFFGCSRLRHYSQLSSLQNAQVNTL